MFFTLEKQWAYIDHEGNSEEARQQRLRCKCSHKEISDEENTATAGSLKNIANPDNAHKSKCKRFTNHCITNHHIIGYQIPQRDFATALDLDTKNREEREEVGRKALDASIAALAQSDNDLCELFKRDHI